MRLHQSKNLKAVIQALKTWTSEEESRKAAGTSSARGPRGIVNARMLGLSLNRPRRGERPAKRIPARLVPAERRAPNVRGKDRPLRVAGYARKAYRARRDELARVMDAMIKNQPRLRTKRDKMIESALAQLADHRSRAL